MGGGGNATPIFFLGYLVEEHQIKIYIQNGYLSGVKTETIQTSVLLDAD